MFHSFQVLTFPTSRHHPTKRFTVSWCSPFPPVDTTLPNVSQFPGAHLSHQQTPPYQTFHSFQVLTFPTSRHHPTKRFTVSWCSPFPPVDTTLPNVSQFPGAHLSHQQTSPYQAFHSFLVLTFPTSRHHPTKRFTVSWCSPFPPADTTLPNVSQFPGAHLSHQQTPPYQAFHSFLVLTFPHQLTPPYQMFHSFLVLTFPTSRHHPTKRFTVSWCSPFPPVDTTLPNVSQFPGAHLSHQQTPPYQTFHSFQVLTFPTSRHHPTKCFTVSRCSPFPPADTTLPSVSQFPGAHLSHQLTPPYQMFHSFLVLTFPTNRHHPTKRFTVSRCSPFPPADTTLPSVSQFPGAHLSHQLTPPYQMFHSFLVLTFPTSRHHPTKRFTVSWCSPFPPVDTTLPNVSQFPGAHLSHQQTPPYQTFHSFQVLTFPTSRHHPTKRFTVYWCSPFPPVDTTLPNVSQFPGAHLSHQQTPPYQTFHSFQVLTFPTSRHHPTKRFTVSWCSPFPPVDTTLPNVSQFPGAHLSHQQTPPYQTFHSFQVLTFPTSRHHPTKRFTVSWCSPFPPVDTTLPNVSQFPGAHLSHQQTPPYQTFHSFQVLTFPNSRHHPTKRFTVSWCSPFPPVDTTLPNVSQFPGAHISHQQTPPYQAFHSFLMLIFPPADTTLPNVSQFQSAHISHKQTPFYQTFYRFPPADITLPIV